MSSTKKCLSVARWCGAGALSVNTKLDKDTGDPGRAQNSSASTDSERSIWDASDVPESSAKGASDCELGCASGILDCNNCWKDPIGWTKRTVATPYRCKSRKVEHSGGNLQSAKGTRSLYVVSESRLPLSKATYYATIPGTAFTIVEVTKNERASNALAADWHIPATLEACSLSAASWQSAPCAEQEN